MSLSANRLVSALVTLATVSLVSAVVGQFLHFTAVLTPFAVVTLLSMATAVVITIVAERSARSARPLTEGDADGSADGL